MQTLNESRVTCRKAKEGANRRAHAEFVLTRTATAVKGRRECATVAIGRHPRAGSQREQESNNEHTEIPALIVAAAGDGLPRVKQHPLRPSAANLPNTFGT